MGIHAGDDTFVNTYTSGFETSPTTTILADGGWVVTWRMADVFDTSNPYQGLYQQIYGSDGNPVGDETRVNLASQRFPQGPASVLALADGGWVVAWQDESGDICQQRFDASGVPILPEEEIVVSAIENAGSSTAPRFQALGEGWTVTWSASGADANWEIYQQAFGADGEADGSIEVVNSVTAGTQQLPYITTLEGGNWIVSWQSDAIAGGIGPGIEQRMFDADGDPVGNVVTVMTTSSAIASGTVTALARGGWVTTWLDVNPETPGVRQQAFNANGEPQGDITVIDCTRVTEQQNPQTTALKNGGWVTLYIDDTSGKRGVYAQIFGADGSAVGETKYVNTGFFTPPGMAAVALEGGGWVMGWIRPGQGAMKMQAFSDDGTALTSEILVNPTTEDIPLNPSMVALEDGGWIVSYSHNTGDGTYDNVHTRMFHLNNDAPTGADSTIVVAEEATHAFAEADFGFSDVNQDLLGSVTLTALPGIGTFLLDGVAVEIGDEILAGDIGDLTWTGDKDAFGTGLAVIGFTLKDDGGTAFDGVDISAEGYTLTFDVTDVVDTFVGKKRADTLIGTQGADILNGKAGRDKLTGNEAADTFVFRQGYDRDTINDFEAGGDVTQDLIDISRIKGIDNIKDLKPLMEEHGNQVWIDFGDGDELIIRGVSIKELGKADFMF